MQTFELEVMAVKEGHFVKNLKRRYFRLVGDTSKPGQRTLQMYYGPDKKSATKVVDLVGAVVDTQSKHLGGFPSEHVCTITLDKKRNGDMHTFILCFDSPSECSEWSSVIHAFNSADSSAAEARDYLTLIQEGAEAGKVPSRPLVTLRNLCVRNPSFRTAVIACEGGAASVTALLLHEDTDIQLSAISIVAACCDSPEHTQSFQSAGALKGLLRCTKDHSGAADDPDGRRSEAALLAVAQMCSMSTSCQDVIKEVAGLGLFLKVMSLMKLKRRDSMLLKKLVRHKSAVQPHESLTPRLGLLEVPCALCEHRNQVRHHLQGGSRQVRVQGLSFITAA